MNPSTQTTGEKKSFFSNLANPILRKMEKNAEYEDASVCSYSGIVGKTAYFLVITVAGVILFFLLHMLMTSNAADADLIYHFVDQKGVFDLTINVFEGFLLFAAILVDIIVPFLALFVRKAIPVIGTIYCLTQGLVIGFVTVALASNLKFLSILAMILTIALVSAMLFVYSKHIIQINRKFKGFIFAAFLAIVLTGIVTLILSLIPLTRRFIASVTGNPVVSIVTSIIFVVIAALFMLADFDTIEKCVRGGMDKEYEWMAAWGLAYTILYIYFKILRILIMIFGNSKSSSSKSF